MMRGNILLVAVCLAVLPFSAFAKQQKMAPAPWLEREFAFSLDKIFAHSAVPGMPVGSVIASPSRSDPDYFFHWIRDAALTMDTLVTLRERTKDAGEKARLLNRLFAYADFSRKNQATQTMTGLGEPKFNVDGTAFNGPWGRPQNDGPALRAIVFLRLADQLIAEGRIDLVRREFYNGTNASLIKMDLEYVSHHWQQASFDLWEEVLGDHFYTRMVQRRALLLGARLAARLGDDGAASWYRQQGAAVEKSIEQFWDPHKGYVRVTLGTRNDLNYKTSGLDIAVALGAIHGGMNDGFFDIHDMRVIKTIDRLVGVFRELYTINARGGVPGVAIGRYPEDRYGGTHFDGGNPWVLATLAVAEAYYHNARSRAAIEAGDEFVARVIYHANGDGTLSEQMHRDSGYMCSAENLTWNYGAVLTTTLARNDALVRVLGGSSSR